MILNLKPFAANEKSETFEVYESQTFVADHLLAIKEFNDSRDIESSQAKHCLYCLSTKLVKIQNVRSLHSIEMSKL